MTLSPDLVDALRAALTDGGGPAGHPDAPQDMALIKQELAAELGPVFELLASQIQSLRQELESTQDIVVKLITGAHDAYTTHQRAGLMDNLKSKFGADMEPYSGIYSDLQGRDMLEDIVDQIMQHGVGDEDQEPFVKSFLDQVGGKFGKYVGKPDAVAVKVETAEPANESEDEPAKPDEESSEPESPAAKLMSQLASASKRGK